MNDEGDRERLFWDIAAELLDHPSVARSTMMGYPCLRRDGTFFACVERATGHLIVKLPADHVNELVASGQALVFAPNGRTFREWAVFPSADRDTWLARVNEALAFAATT